jgi:hypothetical protein
MKLFPSVTCLAIFAGAVLTVSPGRAQLVHVSFTESRSDDMIFRANSPEIPWNNSGGFMSRFDLWYDVTDSKNPSRNIWRASIHAHELGDFEIVRSHETLEFNDLYLMLQLWPDTWPAPESFELLDLVIELYEADVPEQGLPVPPFRVNAYGLSLSGGRSYIDVPDLAGFSGSGVFNQSSVSVVQSIELTPVPEASTYAWGAIALLGIAVVIARRRRVAFGAH